MKGSGGLKKSPPSSLTGRKNPPVPKIPPPPRTPSVPREKRSASPISKYRPPRSPSSSRKNVSRPPSQPVRKQFSPIRGTSATRKSVVTPGRLKKQSKKSKVTQTTSSLIDHDKLALLGSVLDTARELEQILLSDNREDTNSVPAPSEDLKPEPKLDTSEDLQSVQTCIVSEPRIVSSKENERHLLQSVSVHLSTEEVREEGEFQSCPPLKENLRDNTLDVHIASLRNLVNARNLQNENYSVVSQLKGSSVISTEGRVTISTGDNHITISNVESHSSDGADSVGDQSNVTAEATSAYAEVPSEPKLVISNQVKSNVSTIIIESEGRRYSNNDEETRELIISNDPNHPLARKTVSTPAQSAVPATKPPTCIIAPQSRVASPVVSSNKPGIYEPLTSSGKDIVSPEIHPAKQPENAASDVSKFVLVVDLNKSVINQPDVTNSVKSKFAVTSIRSQFESGTDVRRPYIEGIGEEERSNSQNSNKRVLSENAVDVRESQNPQHSLRNDESESQRFFKQYPLMTSECRIYPDLSRTRISSRTVNKDEVTPNKVITTASARSASPLNKTYSIKEYDPFERETDRHPKSPSKKKFWEYKNISDQSKTKHACGIWEAGERKTYQDNIESSSTAIRCNYDSVAKNSEAGSSIGMITDKRLTSSVVTKEFQTVASTDTHIGYKNKENEPPKKYAVVNNSTVANDTKKFERQKIAFSLNDILVQKINEENEPLEPAKKSNEKCRIQTKTSAKSVDSYVTVKESNSCSHHEVDAKMKKDSSDNIAQKL